LRFGGEKIMDKREFTDKELLDFLQEQTNKAEYTGKVICRKSGTGRGWRLHETSLSESGATINVRQAIADYMFEVQWKDIEEEAFDNDHCDACTCTDCYYKKQEEN